MHKYVIDDLLNYQGTNPRPDDFDAFWQQGLEELNLVDAAVSLKPVAFDVPYAECYDLFFTGMDGARIHAMFLRPKTVLEKCPVVMQFHGYTKSAGDYFDKLPYVAAGYCVAAMDCRGQGGISEDIGGVVGFTYKGHIIRGLAEEDPAKLLLRNMFLDVVQLAEIVTRMGETDETRMGVCGYSQGGALALVCAAMVPQIRKAAVMFPYLSDYQKAWEMGEEAIAYAELAEYFRSSDPLHKTEGEVFRRLGYIDTQHFADRIRADVLFGTGLSDVDVPPETQFAIYNKIHSKKELVVYPDYGHEYVIPKYNDLMFAHLMQL